ncbi:MAG: hypothetical protein R3D86_13580 [Emcibacteraceae bacterium]
MALVAMFIKQKFNVPSYFFMHTDWINFIKNTTDLNIHERDRVRRLLRAFYNEFDGIFVLNTDHRKWLASHEMMLDKNKIHLAAHHSEPRNYSIEPIQKADIVPGANQDTPVLFIACRLSREKGVFNCRKSWKGREKKYRTLKLSLQDRVRPKKSSKTDARRRLHRLAVKRTACRPFISG